MVPQKNATLDLCRGLAALMVLVVHLREETIPYVVAGVPRGWVEWLSRLPMALPNCAVPMFFVLSGYWVGGGILKALHEGRWSLKHYAVQRFTRLYCALIPALAITWVVDLIGAHLRGAWQYRACDHGMKCLLANVFFLQGIYTPVFGTNGPLGFLGMEFWYYVLAIPVLWIIPRGKNIPVKAAGLLWVAALCCWLPTFTLLRSTEWWMGVAVYAIEGRPFLRKLMMTPYVFAASGFTLICGLSISLPFTEAGSFVNYLSFGLMALGFAGLLIKLKSFHPSLPAYGKVSKWLSETSYSLYLVHFPVLSFIIFNYLPHGTLTPGWKYRLIYAGILILILAWARMFWYVFERRTPDVRAWFNRKWPVVMKTDPNILNLTSQLKPRL